MDSTIMRSLIVDNVGFDDTLWQEMPMSSSDSSFVKYSMDLMNGDSVISDNTECPCLSPPPDFDIRPPPKPLFFADGDSANELQMDDTCPVDFPGFVSNTIVPNKDGGGTTSVNEPLIFIITAATVMAMALIVFTIVIIWCQKKGWCKSWSNSKTSKLNSATFSSETEESTAGYSTGACHKTEWSFNSMKAEKKFAQVPNLGILMYSGAVQQQDIVRNGHVALQQQPPPQNRPLPTLPKNCTLTNNIATLNRRNCDDVTSTRTYDSHNPVYEEISLSGIIPFVECNDEQQYYVCEKCPTDVGTANLLNNQQNRCDSFSQSEVESSSTSSNNSESPCSCQSCGKSTSIANEFLSPAITPAKRNSNKVNKINQSTQSEETFLQADSCCECTNNGRESGYGTEGYPARDAFGTWDSPRRTSPPIVAKRISKNKNTRDTSSNSPNLHNSASLTKRPQNVWVTAEEKSKRTATGPFAVFSSDNLGSSSAYV